MSRFTVSAVIAAAICGLLLAATPLPSWLDTVILLGVAATYTVGWLQMLIYRRVWTWRAVGIFWTALADATVYFALGFAKFTHLPDAVFDLARAAFIIGAPLFAFGTIRYLTRGGDDPAPDDSPDPPTGLP